MRHHRIDHGVRLNACIAAVLIPLLLASRAEASKEAKAKRNRDNRNVSEASADSPAPHIAYLFPAGGQRGTEVKVTLAGQGLRNVKSVHVSGDGVEGTTKAGTDDTKLTVSIKIAPDAALGERDLRVISAAGASNRFRFIVGQHPEVFEKEPNSRQTQAQRIGSLPMVINGQLLSSDVDDFRFAARAGQKLVLRVEARSLLPFIADAVPGWAQATLAVHAASGGELAYVDDFRFEPDPVLIFNVLQDGDYIAEIHDALFRGREDFIYRLTIGEVPFISDVFPLSVRRGTSPRVEIHGANLPAELLPTRIRLDAGDEWPVIASTGEIASNVRMLSIGDLPEAREIEPNNSIEQANRLKLPISINGRIQRAGDSDVFGIRVEAGQQIVFDVQARRLGSPLDSMLTLMDSKGNVLASNDDTSDPAVMMLTHQADSHLVWKCSKTGDYFVRVADTQSKGDDAHAYCLTMSAPRPDFSLRLLPDNPRLTPGGTAVFTAEALRRDGFGDEIHLALSKPSEGWTIAGGTIPAGETQARFTLTAPVDVSAGLLTPVITGTARSAAKEIVRTAWPAEEVVQAFSYQHRLRTQELLLSVLEGSTFTISIELPPAGVVEVPQDGQTELKVIVNRQSKFDGPVRITLDGQIKGIAMKTATIGAGEKEAVVVVTGAPMAPIGFKQNLIVSGNMRMGKGVITRYAPAVPFRIVPKRNIESRPATVSTQPDGARAAHSSRDSTK